jgi:hypothetical protein
MKLHPNETRFVATIAAISSTPDGVGSDVTCQVESVATPHDQDFLGLTPGETRHFYFPGDTRVIAGRRYTCTATMLGGPGGERAVLRTLRAARR